MGADIVFEGRVTAVGEWEDERGAPVTFDVQAAWSGLGSEQHTVTVWVYQDSCSDIINGRPQERLGEVWLVRASVRDDGDLLGGGCSSSPIELGAALPELAALGTPRWAREDAKSPTQRFDEAIRRRDADAARQALAAGADGRAFPPDLYDLVVDRCDATTAALLTEAGVVPGPFFAQNVDCRPAALGALVRAIPADVWSDVLRDAANDGDRDRIEAMLAGGVSLDTDDALIAAALRLGHVDVARLLWERGATVHTRDLLAASRRPELADLVARPHRPFPRDELCDAGSVAGVASLTWLLDQGLRGVRCDGLQNGGPVVGAANAGDADRMRLLLDARMNPDERMQDGQTALIQAIAWDHLEVAEMLLDAGAHPDVADDQGQTPLVLAISRENTEVVHLLLAHGANPDFVGRGGAGAAGMAAAKGSIAYLELLVDAGASLERADGGLRPLAVAAGQGRVDVVRWLLAHGSPADGAGPSPLWYAAAAGNAEIVGLLLHAGARTAVQVDDTTPRERALMCGHPDVAAMLPTE